MNIKQASLGIGYIEQTPVEKDLDNILGFL